MTGRLLSSPKVEHRNALCTVKLSHAADTGNAIIRAEGQPIARTKRGKKMTRTGGWLLKTKKGREREFSGTLLRTFNFGGNRLAIFSVPKRFS
jgi:hypothetical protein